MIQIRYLSCEPVHRGESYRLRQKKQAGLFGATPSGLRDWPRKEEPSKVS
jgi:hypothetical protein